MGTLSTLGLAVFLIGIGLLLLLSIHYYRQRGIVEQKSKYKRKHGRSASEFDPLYQLQFMSREELKEMVLRERAAKQTAEGKAAEQGAQAEEQEDEWGASSLVQLTQATANPVEQAPSPPSSERSSVALPEEPAPAREPHSEQSAEAALLAQLSAEAEEEQDEKPKEPPKPKYHDLVERSALSNELPEEFRRKSRRV